MKEKVFKACLKCIEKDGWKSFSFAKAAEDSGIPLKDFHATFKTPTDVMIHLFQKVDNAVFKSVELTEDEPTRDKLFEIFMARFDALTPYKPVIASFWRDFYLTPEELPRLGCHGLSSMAWMLETASLESRGLKGMMRVQGLTMLYLYALREWLADDSPDLGKTMVALDKGLSNLEKISKLLHIS